MSMASPTSSEDAKDAQGPTISCTNTASETLSKATDDGEESRLESGNLQKKHTDEVAASNSFDLSAMSGLLNDPSIKELAEQIAKDPAFRNMAKALQNSLQSDGQSSIPKANTPAYFNSIEKIMDNPQFMNMAESLGSTLMQDSHTASILQNLRSSGEKEAEKYEVQIDPNLMPILEEIERGGPAMMMKYMDDPQLLSKLGKAVGVTIPEQFSFVGDVNDTLHEEGARVDDQDGLPLLNAASIGDIEAIKSLLADGANKAQTDDIGRTALHLASGYGEATCAEALLETGVSIDAVDKNKNTALHYAAGYGTEDCVKLLLKYGASVTIQNLDGKTAVEVAQMNNQVNIMKLLQTDAFL